MAGASRFGKLLPWRKFRAVAPGQNMAQVLPPQVFQEVVVINQHIPKALAFRRHQQRRGAVMPPQQVAVPFLQGKKAVNGRANLAAHIPVVQRRCQHDYIALPDSRINFVHIIVLNTGTFPAAVSAKAAFAAVNIHGVQEKLLHRVPRFFRPVGERPYQGGGISVSSGTSVQYHNLFAHSCSSSFSRFSELTSPAADIIIITRIRQTASTHIKV